MSDIEKFRFVPTGKYSLISDAPGWSSNANISDNSENEGPKCWKCKGNALLKVKLKINTSDINLDDDDNNKRRKKKQKSESIMEPCKVCSGKGFLPKKKQEIIALHSQPGMITRRRHSRPDWKCSGPKAAAIVEMERFIESSRNESEDIDPNRKKHHKALELLHQIMTEDISNVEGICIPNDIISEPYPWLPIHNGEQLCNLVGSWRILQRRASHRWTTDDICTAYIAIKEQKCLMGSDNTEQQKSLKLNYLDLGCGNGSVLQMTSWGLMEDYTSFNAFGIEARSEAVNLARRSLTFNIGTRRGDSVDSSKCIFILHRDFRDLDRDFPFLKHNSATSSNNELILSKLQECAGQKFDLITGTPPYFRVDFETKCEKNSSDKMVTSAVISQGGMPSSKQSAPARCEFRGGIEAYCIAASKVMSDNGIFVVCENWLNHHRVSLAASSAGLHVKKVIPFKGKESNPNLFAVYVLEKNIQGSHPSKTVTEGAICVRSLDGRWTPAYRKILHYMSIPSD